MCQYATTERSRVRIYSEFASYERDTVHQIIDQAPICHVAAVIEGAPYLQATVHWRIGDKLYMHGAVKNKMVQALKKGAEACLSFTHFDGYVLTRSAFNHAVMYRSVIAYSKGRWLDSLAEKSQVLEAYVERVQEGRWESVRQPSENELKQTGVVEFELKEVSAKILPQEITPLIMPGGEMEAAEDGDFAALHH